MHQLTVRGFDKELEIQLRKTADALGTSLSKAAIYLMRKGSGLTEKAESKTIGHRLDHLFGGWTEEEEKEFHDAIRGLDEVDEEMWS